MSRKQLISVISVQHIASFHLLGMYMELGAWWFLAGFLLPGCLSLTKVWASGKERWKNHNAVYEWMWMGQLLSNRCLTSLTIWLRTLHWAPDTYHFCTSSEVSFSQGWKVHNHSHDLDDGRWMDSLVSFALCRTVSPESFISVTKLGMLLANGSCGISW